MRFLHCSDVHVTQDYLRKRTEEPLGWRRWFGMLEHTVGGRGADYRHAGDTLARIVADGAKHGVDRVLVTGDLTAYAMDEEFRRAREALGTIGQSRATCSVIPGNHDYFTPDAVSSGRFERHFAHLLESDLPEYRCEGPYPFVHLAGDDVAVVGLRSALLPGFPGIGFGAVGAAQLDAVRAILADARVRHRVVLAMVHHAPILANGRRDTPWHGLRDAVPLLDVLRGPRVALLHGHVHRRYHHPATAARPHIFAAGSSTRSGHVGYWLIDVIDGRIGGVRIEYRS